MASSSGSVALAEKLQGLNGLFAIHKKKGPTSADVLNLLKANLLKEAGIKQHPMKRKKQVLKLGHGGTLDSAASGVLVVGIGKGTKMLGGMLSCSKIYTTIGEFGKATDTFDALGTVTDVQSYDHITKDDLETTLKKFTGNIMQTPPIYSALKQNGQRLSCLVKKGEAVEAKPARPVVVFGLSVQDYNPPLFTLNVECGSGFYVRSLVNDLGKELSSCAHVKELIRTKQGPFTLDEHALQEEKWTISEIVKAVESCVQLVPSEAALKKLKINYQDDTEQVKEAA
ncbi:probable tRNA pseudouridine synthase 1 [Stegostoma tigrinum]|uniref:probable tRNA pseudouridine synthase 1 n=1 Tax=Stegostoma tigrinum TaxID=3053191 RepID=UPI00202B74B1|nr:probable tRNA pseudouridine synthase 1 [Stegostoma tigrinum]XP_048406958.1 probable tRNA pseudouridine synthase 1 [Stegostoma tigrinum]XP_059509021.1 probable tRNA pseudouridine synthase 1 [Stegostoma tigrinum]